jgi:WD40 repeat protein
LAARYLPNGRDVILGDLNIDGVGGLRLWRPQTHRIRTLSSTGTIVGLDVRSDGAVAAVDELGQAEIRTHGPGRIVPEHDLRSAVFDPRGERLVTAGVSGVRIWDIRTMKPLLDLPYRANVLYASFSPDGKLIATASADTTARIWDASTGKELHVLRGHTGSVTSARFSPDGRLLVTSSKDNTVRVWDAASGALDAIFGDHTDIVWNASFSPDGKRIATASSDDTARIYTFAPIDELRKAAARLLAGSVTPEQERAIVEQP